jgi:hypothetical protein
MSVKNHSFGKSGWDQWKVVEGYVDHGIEQLEKLNEFMKRQAELESEYAKGLQKLVKQHKDDILRKSQDKSVLYFSAFQNGTVHQSWIHLLDKIEGIASQHLTVSDQLELHLRKTVKYRAKDNDKLKKQHFDDIKKAIQELTKQFDLLDKAKQKYDKGMKDMDTAKQTYETNLKDSIASKKNLDYYKSDLEKKTVLAHEQMKIYQTAIGNFFCYFV